MKCKNRILKAIVYIAVFASKSDPLGALQASPKSVLVSRMIYLDCLIEFNRSNFLPKKKHSGSILEASQGSTSLKSDFDSELVQVVQDSKHGVFRQL